MKIISEQIIRSLNIKPADCVKWIIESFSIKKEAQLPVKTSVHPTGTDFFTSMPCLLPPPSVEEATGFERKRQYFGIKEVHRIEGVTPSLGSDMMLYDAKTGELLALVDCDWITAMRTGAVAAVTAKVLRKKEAKVYGLIGLGNTARATLLCILEQEPDRHFHFKLFKYKNQAENFIERFKDYANITFEVCNDLNSIIRTVDVFISCITSANGLLCENETDFQPGITVIPVHMRGFQNCDTTFDRVFGDDTDHVRNFKYFPQYNDYNEIGEVLSGVDSGRKSDEQRIIAYNYGLALHDVVYASKIYELVSNMPTNEIEIKKETNKFWI